MENDHNFVFLDYKVSTQQYFEKNAEKLRIHTCLASLAKRCVRRLVANLKPDVGPQLLEK